MQATTVIDGRRQNRDGIERALDYHASCGRIRSWARMPDADGHRIGLCDGDPLTTRTLRETALVVLALASADLGSRPRRLT